MTDPSKNNIKSFDGHSTKKKMTQGERNMQELLAFLWFFFIVGVIILIVYGGYKWVGSTEIGSTKLFTSSYEQLAENTAEVKQLPESEVTRLYLSEVRKAVSSDGVSIIEYAKLSDIYEDAVVEDNRNKVLSLSTE